MRVSQHTAQASAKALLGTRLYIVDIGKLHIPWAPQVVDLKITQVLSGAKKGLRGKAYKAAISLGIKAGTTNR